MAQKFTSLIPLKGHSQRVPGKNLRMLAGRPLYQWICLALRESALVGDIAIIRGQSLHGFSLTGKDTAAVIDEIPALAILATQCDGQTAVSDAGELRVKESDRLAAIIQNLRKMGVKILDNENGFSLTGPQQLSGATINPNGDHRIAMAFALAGLIADGETEILQAECADVSYPQFWQELIHISGKTVQLEEEQ